MFGSYCPFTPSLVAPLRHWEPAPGEQKGGRVDALLVFWSQHVYTGFNWQNQLLVINLQLHVIRNWVTSSSFLYPHCFLPLTPRSIIQRMYALWCGWGTSQHSFIHFLLLRKEGCWSLSQLTLLDGSETSRQGWHRGTNKDERSHLWAI